MDLTNQLCIITPRMPPAMDGIGDYCHELVRNWPDRSKAPRHFVVADGGQATQTKFPQWTVKEVGKSTQELISALENSACSMALLQYVGYGYESHGHPEWLAEGLSGWKRRKDERRLLVMFHETWATG